MQRCIYILWISLGACAGCTTVQLERHTVNQSMSMTTMRYQQALDNLAVVVKNPGILPSFSTSAGGIVKVTNTASLDEMTTWDRAVLGFSRQLLALTGRHNPDQQWTINPAASSVTWEAVWYACLWQIWGPPPPENVAMDRLRGPTISDTEGYHFDVARYLAEIPPGWFHSGGCFDVPTDACYKASCNGTYIWVNHDGMAAFSEFTLVIMDILSTDPSSLIIVHPTATVTRKISDDVSRTNDGIWRTYVEAWPAKQDPTFACNIPGAIIVSPPNNCDPVMLASDKFSTPNPGANPKLNSSMQQQNLMLLH